MPPVAVTSTATAAVRPLDVVKVPSSQITIQKNGACILRPAKSSGCNATCAIILGCLFGACFLIALGVLLWWFLAAKRRREQQHMEEDDCNKEQSYTGEEDTEIPENSAEASTSMTSEQDALPGVLSANPLSVASSRGGGAVGEMPSSSPSIGEDQAMPLSQTPSTSLMPKRSARSWRARGRGRGQGLSVATFSDESVSSIEDDIV